jgi:hypothetical protein
MNFHVTGSLGLCHVRLPPTFRGSHGVEHDLPNVILKLPKGLAMSRIPNCEQCNEVQKIRKLVHRTRGLASRYPLQYRRNFSLELAVSLLKRIRRQRIAIDAIEVALLCDVLRVGCKASVSLRSTTVTLPLDEAKLLR